MTVDKRIEALICLGNYISEFCMENSKNNDSEEKNKFFLEMNKLVGYEQNYNGWFTKDSVLFALSAIGKMLLKESLTSWIKKYNAEKIDLQSELKVGVIMAGNIPLVGFHDFLSTLISGNNFVGKLSSDDKNLLPFIANKLCEIEPEFKNRIRFVEGKMDGFDAVIATGSNNTARYFEFYFGKYPHIIRKSRTSVAILQGNETIEDLSNLGNDIFRYFGLGCRNVNKIYVPEGYDFRNFFEAIEDRNEIINHSKYRNNYEYYKAIFLVNRDPFLDNGFLILKESEALASAVSIVNYEFYNNLENVKLKIESLQQDIQCVVAKSAFINNAIPLGKTQEPNLWDYADGIDTIDFLLKLKN